jgi:hypothetical protein
MTLEKAMQTTKTDSATQHGGKTAQPSSTSMGNEQFSGTANLNNFGMFVRET